MKKNRRIFFICAHKILLQTEVARLRMLGYEVFTPPYLSKVNDQSVIREWVPSSTTLPPKIHDKLSKYNFYHNPINAEMAQMLNEYFDCVIIPSSPNILKDVLSVFHGKVIFRAYGLKDLVSDELQRVGALELFSGIKNFFYLPTSMEILEEEHLWLREMGEVVPYCVTDDIINLQGSWNQHGALTPEICLTSPNIRDPYFRHHYKYLKRHFPEKHFRYYGVQTSHAQDPQIVGTLPRSQQLEQFLQSKGALYTHPSRTVCFLQPIEMMILGAPVVFLDGSLLSRMMPVNSPGRAFSEDEAKGKCERLLEGDKKFIQAIVASQKSVVDRYIPRKVWPVFDRVLQRIIESDTVSRPKFIYFPEKPTSGKRRLAIFMHFPGEPVLFHEGSYFAVEGICRVMRQVAQALIKSGNFEVIITSRSSMIQRIHGFFNMPGSEIQCQVFDVGGADFRIVDKIIQYPIRHHIRNLPKPPLKKIISFAKLGIIVVMKKTIIWCGIQDALRILIAQIRPDKILSALKNDDNIDGIIVPHYYAFPEAAELNKSYLLYLPDYIPHFYPRKKDFKGEKRHLATGQKIVAGAKLILTNSKYSQEYLPQTELFPPVEKIRYFPLPNLQGNFDRTSKPNRSVMETVQHLDYLFYPTRDRPSKRLDVLLKALQLLHKESKYTNFCLVLTSDLSPENQGLLKSLDLEKYVHIVQDVSDATLSWLYKRAACLVFTSELEGNFPTQVNEALALNVPIVASNIPLITREIPDQIEYLHLAEVGNAADFKAKLVQALHNRKQTIKAQERIREKIAQLGDPAKFKKNVNRLLSELVEP